MLTYLHITLLNIVVMLHSKYEMWHDPLIVSASKALLSSDYKHILYDICMNCITGDFPDISSSQTTTVHLSECEWKRCWNGWQKSQSKQIMFFPVLNQFFSNPESQDFKYIEQFIWKFSDISTVVMFEITTLSVSMSNTETSIYI